MKLREGLSVRKVCNETVVVPEGMGNVNFSKIIGLNATAEFLWKKASEGDFTSEALVQSLCDEYDVTEEMATADVKSFVEKLKEEDIIIE